MTSSAPPPPPPLSINPSTRFRVLSFPRGSASFPGRALPPGAQSRNRRGGSKSMTPQPPREEACPEPPTRPSTLQKASLLPSCNAQEHQATWKPGLGRSPTPPTPNKSPLATWPQDQVAQQLGLNHRPLIRLGLTGSGLAESAALLPAKNLPLGMLRTDPGTV